MHAAIIKTVCYADIFRYPLKPSEIIKYAIGFNIKKSDLNNLGPKIQKTNPYYHLIGKSHLVKLRRQRTHYSRQKLKIAKKFYFGTI